MIIEAIKNTYPSVVSIKTIDNDNYSATDENDNEVALDTTVISVELAKLQAEYDTQEYARNRAPAYPSVGDQLDMLMKDMKNGTTTHQEACEAVKAKYPKP